MMIELKGLHPQIFAKERGNIIPIEIPLPVTKEIIKPKGTISINEAMQVRRERNMFADGIDETWLKLQIQAVLDNQESLLGPYAGIDGCWKDEPCFVVGGSQGLRNAIKDGFKFDMLRAGHSIGINHVIEDYHYFDWFTLQDKRFFNVSRWDVMNHFKGKIFAHIRTRMLPSDRVTIVYTQEDGPTEHIIDGLYSFIATGIAAINLAICSGANPIYLIGLDNGGQKNDQSCTHYKNDYPGAKLNCANWPKYIHKIPRICEKFAPFADRIINVDPLGDIQTFKKIAWHEVKI
jgi:hypothetical protein